MFAVLECVAEAVKNKGFKGLCEFVPGGGYLLDIAGDAYRIIRERKKEAALREELARIASVSAEEGRRAAEEVVRQVAKDAKPDEQLALELYLTQIPGAIRQSMKRADDPSGKSVPADFAVNSPQDLARLLPPRAPHFRPGAELPHRSGWKLEELLGAGGFGEVWLARHSFIPNPRAVKFCTDPLVRTKLTSHEGKVIARVMGEGHHPNVVPLVDAVLDGDTPWLMYEYVGGGCLTDLIHRWQALPAIEREAAAVVALHQLAAAVGMFHRLSPPIVHRDLKPANVLVTSAATTELRITDFGIGGVAVDYLRQQSPTGMSMMSMMSGYLETSLRGSYTPIYASPQQRTGNAPDPRDDVHALGVIGFHMMTGRLTESPGIDANQDLEEAGASVGYVQLITKCVATKPDRRPKDGREVAEKLMELKAGKSTPETKKPTDTKPAPAKPAEQTQTQSQSQGFWQKPPTVVPPIPGTKSPAPSPQAKAGPLEGGTAIITPVVLSPTKWLIPLRGMWFSRPTDNAEVAWTPNSVKLPGEVTAKPGEAYRFTLNPDTTTDTELAKIRTLSGMPGLEAVDLSGCRLVTDAGLMHLAQLRGLKAVGLADTQVTDSGLTLLLTRFPDLEAVGLAGAEKLTQTVIPYLTRLRKLKMLTLPPRADSVDVRVEFAKRRPACKLG
ncbi:MAG: protein kinase [Planctomycetes bacterium]|nr:protein kinase [Planctomycetota bacterium]